jgi:hypothetical protein
MAGDIKAMLTAVNALKLLPPKWHSWRLDSGPMLRADRRNAT